MAMNRFALHILHCDVENAVLFIKFGTNVQKIIKFIKYVLYLPDKYVKIKRVRLQ